MAASPTILAPDVGFHNADLTRAQARLLRGSSYKDCSTVCITPAIAPIPSRIVQTWMNLMHPMNQKWAHLMLENYEVGDAYSAALDFVLTNPEMSQWKYVLTLETDNAPPPDGLLKLIEDIESGPYDAVQGLYWTKGAGGMPMCYGDPTVMPKNFIPFLPPADSVTPCNGLGMGFTLFRMSMLKDPKLPKPLFKTIQEYRPYEGSRAFTQDLAAFNELGALGYRFACSTRVLVGHWDQAGGQMW